jgi:hypothetical protein
MSEGFGLDFRGDRRSADRALWKHLHDITSSEIGGEEILNLSESWVVEWTERDDSGRFIDTGTHSIFRVRHLADNKARALASRSRHSISYSVRRIQHPSGMLSKSVRFRGYRKVISTNERGPLLTRDAMVQMRKRDPHSRFVRCYARMP